MRVTKKNLAHTNKILSQLAYILNHYQMCGGSDINTQINLTQNTVDELERLYSELEHDLTGFDEYLTEQGKLAERNIAIVEELESF